MNKLKSIKKIYVYAPGDPTVGIPSSEVEIDLGGGISWDKEDRGHIKKIIQDCFNEVLDDYTSVSFDYELIIN